MFRIDNLLVTHDERVRSYKCSDKSLSKSFVRSSTLQLSEVLTEFTGFNATHHFTSDWLKLWHVQQQREGMFQRKHSLLRRCAKTSHCLLLTWREETVFIITETKANDQTCDITFWSAPRNLISIRLFTDLKNTPQEAASDKPERTLITWSKWRMCGLLSQSDVFISL